MAKRAVLYARVSGDDIKFGKEGRNLAEQLRECREYAQGKGYTIVAELAEDDRGASGASEDLPQLARFLSMAKAREFDILVVREMDRLARKFSKAKWIDEELAEAGIEVKFVLEDYASNPAGRLSKNVRASVAEWEAEEIASRTMRARRVKAQQGSVIAHGHALYGYKLVKADGKSRFEIDPSEAKIVRLVFSLYSQGGSVPSITRELTRLGIPTPADNHPSHPKLRKRGEWGRTTIYRILTSPSYIGEWYYGQRSPKSFRSQQRVINPKETWIKVPVPPIVDKDVWEATQRTLAKHRQKGGGNNTRYEYLLRGHVFCGSCAALLTGRGKRLDGHDYLYYVCAFPRVGREHGYRGFPSRVVDKICWEWIKQLLSDPDAIREGLAAYRAQQDLSAGPIHIHLSTIDGLLAEKRTTLKRLLDLYLSGEFEKSVLMERRAELEKTIADLEAEHADLQGSLDKQSITPEAEQTVLEFARKVAKGLRAADMNFKTRRAIIEALEVAATLYQDERREKTVRIKCILGDEKVCTLSPAIQDWRINGDQNPEVETL